MSQSTLAVGTGSKHARMYDLRSHTAAVAQVSFQAHGRGAVNGISFSPFDNSLFATWSTSGSEVRVWDMRRAAGGVPLLTLPWRGVAQVEWSPTRADVLAAVGVSGAADSRGDAVKLWELTRAASGEEGLAFDQVMERTHPVSEAVDSVSWHPSDEQRLLTMSASGVVQDVTLHDTIPLSWSPNGNLAYALYGGATAAAAKDPEPASAVVRTPALPTRARVGADTSLPSSSFYTHSAYASSCRTCPRQTSPCSCGGGRSMASGWTWSAIRRSLRSSPRCTGPRRRNCGTGSRL